MFRPIYYEFRFFLFFLLMRPPPPISTLFPYTTLFRSCRRCTQATRAITVRAQTRSWTVARSTARRWIRSHRPGSRLRSEEHTSELQSPYDLVCRLLLEKKKKKHKKTHSATIHSNSHIT